MDGQDSKMLKSLELKNFKTWSNARLEFGNITALFGTNSSGKTSLIQFLLLLKQTKEATDRGVSLALDGTYTKLGSYNDVVHCHDEELNIEWKLEIFPREPIVIYDPSKRRHSPLVRSPKMKVGGSVSWTDSGPQCTRLSYEVGDYHAFTLSSKKVDSASYDLKANAINFKFLRTPGRAWQIPGPIKSYAFPDQARTYFQNASFLSDLETAYENQIDDIYYLGPLREPPKREYTWTRSKPLDVGIRGEKAIDAILAATIANETRNLRPRTRLKSFQEMIAYWLTQMGLIHDFEMTELAKGSNYWQAHVTVREGGTSALLTDVGFGISQVLPIVTLLYFVPEGATVILEQPEIHLHPLAQAHLADLIINVSLNRNVQVILESHSEHLLLRLQRRIAEEAIEADQVKMYFCDAPKGSSVLQPLKIDKYGQIKNWPNDFMGDAFGETLAAEKARLKRMRADQ